MRPTPGGMRPFTPASNRMPPSSSQTTSAAAPEYACCTILAPSFPGTGAFQNQRLMVRDMYSHIATVRMNNTGIAVPADLRDAGIWSVRLLQAGQRGEGLLPVGRVEIGSNDRFERGDLFATIASVREQPA